MDHDKHMFVFASYLHYTQTDDLWQHMFFNDDLLTINPQASTLYGNYSEANRNKIISILIDNIFIRNIIKTTSILYEVNKMTKALLIIDYTNDFVADNGSLTCGKPAQAIEDYLLSLANNFLDNGDYVIFPTDGHTGDKFSPEYKLFPPHNIVGTPGQELYGKLKTWFQEHKDSNRVYQFNKNRHSSFQNTNLDNYLRERKIDDLWLTGVCTDICVLHTAIAAYNLNYKITIPKKGVATFTKYGNEWAFDHFKNALGATLI